MKEKIRRMNILLLSELAKLGERFAKIKNAVLNASQRRAARKIIREAEELLVKGKQQLEEQKKKNKK